MGRGAHRRGRPSRRAFTLIEVMIVIAIVLALSTLVALSLFRRQDEAKVSLARVDMSTIESALSQFRLDFGRWPTDAEGIAVLWTRDLLETEDEAEATKWQRYLTKPMATDRWGTEWGYRSVSENGDETMYDLWSAGPDKEEGTDDDLVSWDKDEAGSGGGGFAPPPRPGRGG